MVKDQYYKSEMNKPTKEEGLLVKQWEKILINEHLYNQQPALV